MTSVEALHAVHYLGAIDFDHVMQLTGDSANGRQYIAYSVGYVRALLNGLALELRAILPQLPLT